MTKSITPQLSWQGNVGKANTTHLSWNHMPVPLVWTQYMSQLLVKQIECVQALVFFSTAPNLLPTLQQHMCLQSSLLLKFFNDAFMGKSLPYLGCKLASSAYSSATDVTFLTYLNALIKVLLDRMATHCPVHMCHYRDVFCWVRWAFPRHLCSQVLPVPKMLCTWLAMQQVQISICPLRTFSSVHSPHSAGDIQYDNTK